MLGLIESVHGHCDEFVHVNKGSEGQSQEEVGFEGKDICENLVKLALVYVKKRTIQEKDAFILRCINMASLVVPSRSLGGLEASCMKGRGCNGILKETLKLSI